MDFSAFSSWNAHFGLADAADIAIVAFLCYLGLSWIQRHASGSLLAAAIGILALYGVARFFDLYLTSRLFQAGALAILVAVLLIFQEDLRRAAERFALGGFGSTKRSPGAPSTVDLIVETAQELAEQRIGALVVFPGREPLDRLLRGGEALDGDLSRSLLVSIFHAGSPGHDGAAIIEGRKMSRFAVHLPLSRFPSKVGREGTRHSAALGLAENSDALVVVVSEERGTISIALRGTLEVIEPASLKERLSQFLEELHPQSAARQVPYWLIRNPGLKLTSLLLASLLWLGLAFRVETVQRQYPAALQYRNLPEGWAVEENLAIQPRVTLVGSERDFDGFDPARLTISLDLNNPRQGTAEYPVTAEQVTGAEPLAVFDLDPKSLRLEAYRVTTRTLPVRVRLRGELPSGWRLARVEANPAEVRVQAPAEGETSLDAMETEPIDLSRVRATTSFRVHLDLPPRVRLVEDRAFAVETTLYLERSDAENAPP